MTGYRTIVVNVLTALVTILALPEFTGVLPASAAKYLLLAQAVINVLMRLITTMPVPAVAPRVRRRGARALVFLLFLLSAGVASAQTAKNPTAVTFTCPDHALDTGHEVDIINATGTVVQTIQGGDPAPAANGDVTIALNVQPIAFGTYTIKVRAVAGAAKSVDSTPSDAWERVPGQPGKPRLP